MRAYETAGSKGSDPRRVGPLDRQPGGRSGGPDGQGFAKVLFRIGRWQVAATGLPVAGPRQMADHPCLAAERRARRRCLGAGAAHSALTQAEGGPRQVSGENLKTGPEAWPQVTSSPAASASPQA